MVMFALNPQEIQNGYQQAAAMPLDAGRDTPAGFFEGSGGAIASGLENSAAQLYLMARDTGAAESGRAPTAQETAERQDLLNIMQSLQPKPETTGWLGQVLHGLTSVVPQAVVGGLTAGPVGAAGLVGTAQGYSKTQQLEHEGVDPATARKVGAIEGATQALGIVAPVAIPGRLATRIASGASMNTGIGMAQRGVTQLIECGPGKVLTGMAKRILPDVPAHAVFDPATLAQAKAALMGGTQT